MSSYGECYDELEQLLLLPERRSHNVVYLTPHEIRRAGGYMCHVLLQGLHIIEIPEQMVAAL